MLHLLKQNAVTTVGKSAVAFHLAVAREHQRRPDGIEPQRVSQQPVLIGIHVVNAETGPLNMVAGNEVVVRIGEIRAIARVGDEVAKDNIAFGFPEVNAITAF